MLRRGRLLEMLDGAAATPLTVVNAAVGYGKTTLVRSWCVERPEAVIWMTLDAADDDAVRLWTHLAVAVERLGEGLGQGALSSLGVRGVSLETAVDELMNGLAAYGRPATIVLDDLHAVRSEASLNSIGHAIGRLPDNVRLVASTRSDPAIGLAQLRARRAVAEIRARELAFTIDETSELMLHEGVELSGEGIELLVERTEGWPAGLYLAALWLRDLDDPDAGVRAFAGSARQVGDYLTDEVLTALAPKVREFLVRTSVLRRFTPELCDAVLGAQDSAVVLAELARSNMFLVALDARGEWYRYHHLFGEVLQLELGAEDARELRRRAAAWCRGHGLVEDAIEYSAAAGDTEHMAETLLEHHLEFVWSGRLEQFLRWIRRLPSEVLVDYPLLPAAGAMATSLLSRPELETQRLLAVAERARVEQPQLWTPYVEAVVEVVRSEVIERGDVGAAVEHAHRAVVAARDSDVLSVGVHASLSHALYFAGDLEESRRTAEEVVHRPDAPGRPEGYVGSLGLLALIDAERGRPETAEAWARQAIRFTRQRSQADSWVAALAHLGLALACAQTGRLDEAEREALRGERLRRSPQPTVGHAHALLVLAQVRVSRGRLSRAAPDLQRAQRMIAEFPDPGRLPVIAAALERELTAAHNGGPAQADALEEPSPAELAVLQGLAAGLSRREIGKELYISLNTVKTHTRELYRKLGASSQAEAVARGEALGLIREPTQSPG